MSFDRSDYKATQADKKHERQAEMLPMARIIAGAAPAIGSLTQHDDWNRYLGYLQGFLERLTKQRDIAIAKQNDPSVWEHKDLLKLKADVLVAEAGIEWLGLAISLPNAIIEGAGVAQELITKFEQQTEV